MGGGGWLVGGGGWGGIQEQVSPVHYCLVTNFMKRKLLFPFQYTTSRVSSQRHLEPVESNINFYIHFIERNILSFQWL